MWRFLMLLLAVPSASAVPVPVYTDTHGREWLELGDTSWRRWVDVVNVCNSATGYCDGILEQQNSNTYAQAVDLTGYTWATQDEVRELFYDVAGLPAGSLDTYSAIYPASNGYGDNVFEYFEPTLAFYAGYGSIRILNGFTRDVSYDPARGLVTPTALIFAASYSDENFRIASGWPVEWSDPSIGAYVYKVPEPGSLGLFGLGLIATALMRRLRKRTSQSICDEAQK